MRAALIAACACAGCSTADLAPDVPALRVGVAAESTAEIENVVSSALGGRRVTIADDALTDTSALIIERVRSRRIDRPPELGRDLGQPERFQLVRDGNQCFLVHERTALRYLLTATDCTPE